MTNEESEMTKVETKDDKAVKPSLPKAVLFIIGNEFCERFCFYGMKTVLIFYFTDVLLMNDSEATHSYHEFTMACYFTPLIGAILADSIMGKFRTIFYLSIIYALGNIGLAYGSFIEHSLISLISLGLIAFGTGGIKPCVSAFGGDQFLPGQEDLLKKFFALFYLSINVGSLSSSLLTPIFRSDVKCSVRGDCFPLAFGVPAVLMIFAMIFLIIGKPLYRIIETSKQNVILSYVGCNIYGLKMKMKSLFGLIKEETAERKENWLDWSKAKYDEKMVNDVKRVNRILFLYLPLPFFWALFDQQGSRWTLQADHMDGRLFGEFILKPDQIQVINPILIVILIPLFEYIIYPITDKLNIITKPLQRMTLGGIFAALSFVIAAFLQLKIDSETPVFAPSPSLNHAHITLVNGLSCDLEAVLSANNLSIISSGSLVKTLDRDTSYVPIQFRLPYPNRCPKQLVESFNQTIYKEKIIQGQNQKSIYFYSQPNGTIDYLYFDLPLTAMNPQSSFLKIIYNLPTNVSLNNTFQLRQSDTVYNISLDPSSSSGSTGYIELKPSMFQLNLEHSKFAKDITSRLFRGSYLLVISYDPLTSKVFHQLHQLSELHRVCILWQVIQYTFITIGELMFSITGLEFSYSQAPINMKSVLQASWLLTVSFGNLLVVFITKYIKFKKQSDEFFLFAGLMFIDMLVFAAMAYFYIYVEPNKPEDEEPKINSFVPIQSSNSKPFKISESIHTSNKSESTL